MASAAVLDARAALRVTLAIPACCLAESLQLAALVLAPELMLSEVANSHFGSCIVPGNLNGLEAPACFR